MKSIDPVQLQRLIDGELDCSEIKSLVSQLDDSSDSWRTVATGFIEDRMFKSQFDAIEREGAPQLPLRNQSDTTPTSLPYSWLLSLAASALLTLSIGMLIGAQQFGNGDSPGSTTPVNTAANSLASTDANPQTTNPAVYRMQLQDDQGNQFMETDLPFYPVANWNDVRQHQFKEYPAEMRNRVLNSGYDMQQDTRYLRGRLNDGRHFVIPIRNTKFAPYQ